MCRGANFITMRGVAGDAEGGIRGEVREQARLVQSRKNKK
jgi:hypothetical protein